MRSAHQKPLRIPLSRRWLQFRMTVVPFVVFVVSLGVVAWTWYYHVAAPTLVGKVQAIRAEVTSPRTGTLAGFSFTTYDWVEQGQPIGTIHHSTPDIIDRTLAVTRAEIESLRRGMEPLVSSHRTDLNYEELRFDSMLKRVELAEIAVRIRRAESEYGRMKELFESGLISADAYEAAEATRDALRTESAELTRVVAALETRLEEMSPPWERQGSGEAEADARLQAAIAIQEERLRLAEAELRPIDLIAPMTGMISMIHRRPGETVVAGDPVFTISSAESDRIIAYMRQPITMEPEEGATVKVRKRGGDWAYAEARILTIGSQLEPITPTLVQGMAGLETELGLPIIISTPPALHLRPGETVDIHFD